MKRALVILALLLGAFASAAPASAATGSVRLALSPGARFPNRQFTLDLPAGVKPFDLRVTENGVPVIPHLAPIAGNRVPLSVAVLLDTSNSMRGQALTAAVDAARTLIGRKPARSEAAVFGFAQTPFLIHGWSPSAATFDASLGSIAPSNGTAIWDAVDMASQSVGERHGASRALVLLTDGKDTASSATVADAAKAAMAVHARVFVVGLPGAQTDRANLTQLVSATGGEFVQVRSVGELHRVYASLATELSQQYVLTYASQQRGTGHAVTVALDVAGLQTQVRYRIPPIAVPPAPRATGWWTTTESLVVLSVGVALIVLFSTYLLLRPKRRNPARQLRGYVLGAGSDPTPDAFAQLPARPRRSAPRPGPSQVWARFAADVYRGELSEHPVRVLLLGMAVGTAAMAAAGFVAGQPLAIAAGPALGAVGVWAYVSRRASAWYRHFDGTLPDALTVLASSLRAGHSLLQAVDHAADEADDKTAGEWREVVRQTRLGIPVEDAIEEMTHRVGNRDLRWIALVARVQHQVGGNMAEMFDIVAETVRERYRLRGQLHTLTAQGRMTRWVLTLAPFALGGVLMLASPYYINTFLDSNTGRGMIVAACCMIAVGSLWLKKIVEIEV